MNLKHKLSFRGACLPLAHRGGQANATSLTAAGRESASSSRRTGSYGSLLNAEAFPFLVAFGGAFGKIQPVPHGVFKNLAIDFVI